MVLEIARTQRHMSPVSFTLHTGHRCPECWFLVGSSRLCETLMVWHFQAGSAYKKRVEQRNLVGLGLHIASGNLTSIFS